MSGGYFELAQLHAPMLALAILLAGAALAVIAPYPRLSWAVALAAAIVALGVTAELALRVLIGEAPIVLTEAGVELWPDGVSIFAAPLVAALSVASVLTAASAVGAAPGRMGAQAMALTLCSAAGWIGALFASDLLGLVAATQIGWISAAALAGIGGERGALNGAVRMWTAGGASAALMLLGATLLARALGADELAAAASAHVSAPTMAAVGCVLLLLPLAIAAGLAPLHGWAGPAFGRSHGFSATVLGAVTAIGAGAVFVRLAAHIASAPAVAEGVSAVLVVLGVASVVIGSIQAVGASNLGRLIAYAGATQAGCVLLAAALGSQAGLAAALIQVFAWAAAALALLVGAAAARSSDLSALDGLVRRAPLASVAVTAGALSLMGAPLTIGFLGRWRLIEASVGAGWWWATGAAIAASLAAVFYGGRLIERIYFRRLSEGAEKDSDLWRVVRAPVTIAAILAIVLGLAPDALLRAAMRAAALALGHGP